MGPYAARRVFGRAATDPLPNVAELLDYVRTRHGDDSRARLAVANYMALQLGWRLFEPMLRSATGLDELPQAELRQAVIAEAARILEPH
ncbi:hypothetical protein NIIDMKKI_61400 [Mycobacterium kansasii]|uniref:Uncharacterized protein n=1 Tax=Mycobacterium kansasii TaxID=1768 RepID=A0A7G1IKD8_MYCKA|nr:hypothetical protein NIIDMKKI_61400 [Mycobacterium kansasii]